ncbi:MAG TPA: methyltransferase domain-containing protein [Ktedonobacteraceae bacterium]|nr:methyltransferase domain-containing protein [Ktedonobacteraceae bacterium]
MSLIETEETNKFTFEAFASHPFYTVINRSLVRQALAHLETRPTGEAVTIVDMACGTGAVTRLIAEEMAYQGRPAHLIGVDPSAEALRRAEKGMQEIGAKADFIQGEADALPRIVRNADAAFFCNAIHLVPDKLAAFRQVFSILAPGGIFACNSAFYTNTYVPGTERFYHLWTRRALGWLRKEHPTVRPSRNEKAMAMQWLNPGEYIDQLKQSGFERVDTVEESEMISVDAWRDLGQYWLFIEGALPGVPLSLGAAALEAAVYQVGQELDLTEVPRNWLQIVASKNEE